MTHKNPHLDLVNIDVATNFVEILSFDSQDVEWIRNGYGIST